MRHWIIGAVLGFVPVAGLAQVETSGLLRNNGLAEAIRALEPEPDRKFELGTLLTLHAWERLAQNSIARGFDPRRGLLFPARPSMARMSPAPEAPAEIARAMLVDLGRAQRALEAASEDESFTLDLRDIWFDIDGDGRRGPREGLDQLVLPRDQVRRAADAHEPAPLQVRFDAADRSWLMARLHGTAGAIQLGLAFDPTPVLRDLDLRRPAPALLPRQPDYHDQAAITAELAELEAEQKVLEQKARDRSAAASERRKALTDRARAVQEALRQLPRDAPRPPELAAEQAAVAALQDALNAETLAENRKARDVRRAIAARRAALPADPRRNPMQSFESFVTPLFVMQQALRQQPDAGRVEMALAHLRAMLDLDLHALAQAAAETDDNREWLRGPQQHDTALPDTVLRPASADDLRRIEEARAVLDGRLLIPHPLLPEGTGFSLAAWGRTPGPLDPMAVIQGSGLWPWTQRGPHVAFLDWRSLDAVLTGGFSSRSPLF